MTAAERDTGVEGTGVNGACAAEEWCRVARVRSHQIAVPVMDKIAGAKPPRT